MCNAAAYTLPIKGDARPVAEAGMQITMNTTMVADASG
jgi:hypothetical protein